MAVTRKTIEQAAALPAAEIGECADLCTQATPQPDHGDLLTRLRQAFPKLPFRHVLTRGGWYRLGGVVTGEGARVTDNLVAWAEHESNGEVARVLAKYASAGYVATRFKGRTHYLSAPTSRLARDFVQLEVEEIQEVTDRPLIETDRVPDTLAEFTDPLACTRLDPRPVAPPRYVFRRWLDVGGYLQARGDRDDGTASLRRFLADWVQSSAGDAAPFCRRWVLSLQEAVDRCGETVTSARPVPAGAGTAPLPEPEPDLRGARLANFIHGYDRAAGYPMAWYFHLLSGGGVPYRIAQAVYDDQMGAYDYLPARDLRILRGWVERPYTP